VAVWCAVEETKQVVSKSIHVPGELGNDYEQESSTKLISMESSKLSQNGCINADAKDLQ